MFKLVSAAILSVIVIAGIFAVACAGESPPPTPVTTATAGQLAEMGKAVFATRCTGCHGDSGQGRTAPAIIGANANLGKYNTGQGLLNYVSTAMPGNAPGSLSQHDYLNVASYLLVQNNFVSSGTALDASQLGNINLK